ncbi:MAG: hypothetical protein Q7S04_00575 [Candidatus Moranbacteria bacterium]|nr:hypothetical protein [Candidatus Moranbacteria bacterium]
MNNAFDEILEKSKRDMKEISDEFNVKFREFDTKLESSRKLSISAIYQIVILSSSIVGFSVSLFSIPVLQSRLNLDNLRFSWYFFMSVIMLGFFILIFEGRAKYAKTWKNFQVSRFPDAGDYNYTIKEKIIATSIVILTIFYPANLIFNRVYKEESEKAFKQRINGFVVHKLASIENALIFLENILFILFICGLIILVSSFS